MAALALSSLMAVGRAIAPPVKAAGTFEEKASFLAAHWPKDIPPQGPIPRGFSEIEGSLHPSQCGTCHPSQRADWSATRHAKGMGPGVAGQIRQMVAGGDGAAARVCYRCHAPLAEQSRVRPEGSYDGPNASFDESLEATGVSCAVCHVRSHRRYGPPRRPDLPPLPEGPLPHSGAKYRDEFLRSEFCAPCHQFDPDDSELNGKLIENTYEEWRQSPYAEQGVQCQDCHMPDRRHQWQGIHSREMVERAIEVRVETGEARVRPGRNLDARITVSNVGAGHHLPTYLTPKIRVAAVLMDAEGNPRMDLEKEWLIGREASLDLTEEMYDTRIPAKNSRTYRYKARVARPGEQFRVTLTVFPDHFYRRFFEAVVPGHDEGPLKNQLRQALDETERSSFVVFEKIIPVS